MTATLTRAEVTRRPKTRLSLTADGVATGLYVTLHDSVAMTERGDVLCVPAGSLLTAPLCGGYDGRLDADYSGCTLGTDGESIVYRV